MATTVDRVLVQHADQEAIMLPLIRLSNLLAAGTLAGAVVCVWLLDRSLQGDAAFYVAYKQHQIRALIVPLPLLAQIPVALSLIELYLVRRHKRPFWLTLAGCLCLVGAGLITVRGHFPLNAQISAWSIASPPTDWLQVQRQWTTFHHARVALVLVGFGLLALRTVLPRRGSG